MAGKGPDYRVTVASKESDNRKTGKVGAAWKNEHGGISIQLDPGAVLDWRMCETHYITLWPVEDAPRAGGPRSATRKHPRGAPDHDSPGSHPDDDIPF